MRALVAIPLAVCAAVKSDGGTPDAQVKRGPDQVTGSESDSSPPLREMPPRKEQEGQRVHPVKPLPRPLPETPPDGGAPDKEHE